MFHAALIAGKQLLAVFLPETDPVDFVIDGKRVGGKKALVLRTPAVTRREDFVVEDDVVRS